MGRPLKSGANRQDGKNHAHPCQRRESADHEDRQAERQASLAIAPPQVAPPCVSVVETGHSVPQLA